MGKITLSAKVSKRTMNRLEERAEELGISRSEATDRLLTKALDVEDSNLRLMPVKSDGGTPVEEKLEEHGEEVKKTRAKQEELEEQFESRQQKQTQTQTLQTALTVAGILFIAAQFSVGLPTWFVLLAGTGLVVGLAGTTARGFGYV